MATKMMREMSWTDHLIGWSMIAGIAAVFVRYAQTLALPAHFV